MSDDEKRQHYDRTGSISEPGTHRSPFSQQGFTFFQSSGGGGGFQFHFHFPGGGGGGGASRRDDSVSYGAFFDRILPESHHRPYLIYFFHDFCLECMRVDSVWQELKQVRKAWGVGKKLGGGGGFDLKIEGLDKKIEGVGFENRES